MTDVTNPKIKIIFFYLNLKHYQCVSQMEQYLEFIIYLNEEPKEYCFFYGFQLCFILISLQ